jgi:hypothetical protein
MIREVVERNQRRGVAGEIEIEFAVGEVALWAGEPRRFGELALVGRILECRANGAVLEDRVQHRLGVEVVGYPAVPGEIERRARCGLVGGQLRRGKAVDLDSEADFGEIGLDDLSLLLSWKWVTGV